MNRAPENGRLDHPELERLIAAIAEKQDRDAFARLFTYFAPRVKAYLVRFGTPANQAEELAQETLFRVWQKAYRFDPALASVGVWIFRIARNLRIDQQRRDKSLQEYQQDPSDEPAQPRTTDVVMMGEEREARLREALGSLSDEQAKIVQMSFFHEKPHAEIARDLGLPLGTVKSRIRLAMTRLRVLLGDLT